MTITPDTTRAALSIDERTADLLFQDAHTAHAFTDEPVSLDQVEAIWDLAKWGPTSANFQPMRVTLVQTAAARARLVDLMDDGNKDKTAAAPIVAIVSADRDFHEHLPRVYPQWPGAKEMFDAHPDRASVAVPQAWLQLGYFIVAIRAAGLAAGPMAGFNHEAVDAEFHPDGTRTTIAIVNIGHPAADAFYPRNPRLEFSEAVTVV